MICGDDVMHGTDGADGVLRDLPQHSVAFFSCCAGL